MYISIVDLLWLVFIQGFQVLFYFFELFVLKFLQGSDSFIGFFFFQSQDCLYFSSYNSLGQFWVYGIVGYLFLFQLGFFYFLFSLVCSFKCFVLIGGFGVIDRFRDLFVVYSMVVLKVQQCYFYRVCSNRIWFYRSSLLVSFIF